ncbi:hypothetical protein EDB84DRAFT_1610097 [Lactarius hengduanensis]|nr:hypothetical protein EDB84DRAFT_1610097 [Lactarius hengduanensis]
MTVLFHELLTEDASEGDVTHSNTLPCRIFFPYSHLGPWINHLLKLLSACDWQRCAKPELRRAHLNLAYCLCARYSMTHVNDDYEEAASIVDDSLPPVPRRHSGRTHSQSSRVCGSVGSADQCCTLPRNIQRRQCIVLVPLSTQILLGIIFIVG